MESPKSENASNSVELLKTARNASEIAKAVKRLFPSELIKEAERAEAEASLDGSLDGIKEQVNTALDEFTETVIANSDGRPEAILKAYNWVRETELADAERQANMLRPAALDALRNKLADLPKEDHYPTLVKYAGDDTLSNLLSNQTDVYRWADEVQAMLND